MKPMAKASKFILILVLLASTARGQSGDSLDVVDSIGVVPGSVQPSNLIDGVIVSDSALRPAASIGRSPTGALLRSMVIPGWGQLYNRKYLKALIVAAGEGYCVVQAARYWDLAEQAYDLYTETSDIRWFYDYDFYQDKRNLYLWLSGLSVFLSMIDAYVDAHLANFDIDVTPPFEEPGKVAIAVTVTYHF